MKTIFILIALFITTLCYTQNRYRAWEWPSSLDVGVINNLDTVIQGSDWPDRRTDVANRFYTVTVVAQDLDCDDSEITFGGSNDTIGITGTDTIVYGFE